MKCLRTHGFLLLSAMTVLTASAAAAEPLTTSIAPKVYKGPEGETVTIVYLNPSSAHQVLIKFENFEEADWNGKVIKHEKKSSGEGYTYREDYVSQEMPKRPSIVAKGEGWKTMEVRPKGAKKDVYLGYDDKESKTAKAQEVIDAFSKP